MNLTRVLNEKRSIVLPIALGIVANLLLYALIVFPLSRQVASAQAEATTQHELLAKAVADYNSAKATVTGKKQADAALEKFYKEVLPATSSVARSLTYTRLSQLAKQANVRLEHGNNAISAEKGTKLAKLTTTYTLTGDYRDVRRFIYSLETAPEFIVLENVALTAASEESGRTLAVLLDIATYFRSTDAGA